jgi:hypothetical protein
LRRTALIAATIALLAPAPAAAQSPPHVVASANGATARSSANEGEIISCGAMGCTSAITAPARAPAKWDGELPASAGTAVELVFGRPVRLVGASVVDRNLRGGSGVTVERGTDDQHWRAVIGPGGISDAAALELRETWEGDDDRGHYTVSRTDYVGLRSIAAVSGVKQRSRGGGSVADVDARTPGLVSGRLKFGRKTLGQKSANLSVPRSYRLSVPLSRGARHLLAARRTLKATLTITVRPPSGNPVVLERAVTLRAKPR